MPTFWLAICLANLALQPVLAKDLRAQMQSAGQRIRPVLPKSEELLIDGKPQEATNLILSTFPEPTRTPAECLVLGNVLFAQDRALSFKLHERAARELPAEPEAQYEWALEQHRAGQYEQAAESYAKLIAAKPDQAPTLGLMAECMIRTGKVAVASAFWQRSEKAQTGTLEDLETLLCELHGPEAPQGKRAALLARVDESDLAAVESLIALDVAWERDWWNSGPNIDLLKRDLARIHAKPFSDSRRLDAAFCVAECALAAEDEASVKEPLLTRRFLIDKDHSLPESGRLLSILLDLAINHEVLTKEQARETLAEGVLALARKTKDPEAFNALAYLYVSENRLTEIDAEAWAAVPDARFAGSWLAGAAARGKLTVETPELTRALAQFPDDAIIAGIAVGVARGQGKPLRPYLVQAIKAEYTRLSPGGLLPRRSAKALRSYFKDLARELAATDVPATLKPPTKP